MWAVWLQIFIKKIPKEKAPWKCLSLIMLDSVIKVKKKYYPQTFFEECKYVQESIKKNTNKWKKKKKKKRELMMI